MKKKKLRCREHTIALIKTHLGLPENHNEAINTKESQLWSF